MRLKTVSLHPFGRIDTAHGFDGHRDAGLAREGSGQLGQHLAGGHGGNAVDDRAGAGRGGTGHGGNSRNDAPFLTCRFQLPDITIIDNKTLAMQNNARHRGLTVERLAAH